MYIGTVLYTDCSSVAGSPCEQCEGATTQSTVGLGNFTQLKLIGTGASGTVIQVRDNTTGDMFAMKVIRVWHGMVAWFRAV